MNFTCSVTINAPLDDVMKLHSNPEYYSKWQDGFISYNTFSGTTGELGAKSRIVLSGPGGEMELIETILENNLPLKSVALVEHVHMINTMTNSFESIPENRTKWNSTIEYTKFIGIMPKLMAFFMPGLFRKQTQKWLDQFKTFVENEVS